MYHLFQNLNVPMLLTPPSSLEYLALIPGAIIAITALLVVLIATTHRLGTSRSYLAYLSALGLGAAAVSTYFLWDHTLDRPVFHGMLYLDKFSLLATARCARCRVLLRFS